MSKYNLVISLANCEIIIGFDSPDLASRELAKYQKDLEFGHDFPRGYTKGKDGVLEIRQHVKKNGFMLNAVVININSIHFMQVEIMKNE